VYEALGHPLAIFNDPSLLPAQLRNRHSNDEQQVGPPLWERSSKILTGAYGARSNRYGLGRSHERSPLIPPVFNDRIPGPTPRPLGIRPPPPYEPFSVHPSGATHVHQPLRDPLSLRPAAITKGRFGRSLLLLIVLAQAVAFFFFYDLPSKLDQYSKATARMRERQGAMREEARHLEMERAGLRSESNRLEKERLGLESSTREMEGEKDALESATRRSELERSRLEREKQLLERERQLWGQEKENLRGERERWEKAREIRVPQGAFWDPLLPAPDCRAYGKREYHGALQNIPEGWTDMDACMNMPAEVKGVTLKRPNRCGYVGGSPHIYGFWMVDWDQPDCKPWHQDVTDKVSSGGVALNLFDTAHDIQSPGLYAPRIMYPSY